MDRHYSMFHAKLQLAVFESRVACLALGEKPAQEGGDEAGSAAAGEARCGALLQLFGEAKDYVVGGGQSPLRLQQEMARWTFPLTSRASLSWTLVEAHGMADVPSSMAKIVECGLWV